MITDAKSRLENIKKQFDGMMNRNERVNKSMEMLNNKKVLLCKAYKELEKNHHQKHFLFGLDTFHFQQKLIEFDYNNLKKYNEIINNRVYYDFSHASYVNDELPKATQ